MKRRMRRIKRCVQTIHQTYTKVWMHEKKKKLEPLRNGRPIKLWNGGKTPQDKHWPWNSLKNIRPNFQKIIKKSKLSRVVKVTIDIHKRPMGHSGKMLHLSNYLFICSYMLLYAPITHIYSLKILYFQL